MMHQESFSILHIRDDQVYYTSQLQNQEARREEQDYWTFQPGTEGRVELQWRVKNERNTGAIIGENYCFSQNWKLLFQIGNGKDCCIEYKYPSS